MHLPLSFADDIKHKVDYIVFILQEGGWLSFSPIKVGKGAGHGYDLVRV